MDDQEVMSAISHDYLARATAAEGHIRAFSALTTQTARAAQEAHGASPTAAAAMGRLLTGAALLGADVKERSFRLTIEAEGGGPLGRVVAQAREGGKVRARVQHPHVDLPIREDGKLAVGQAVGTDGFLQVTRDYGGTQLYQGQVALVSGEIGEDLMHYYVQSEQIPTAVALGVLVGRQGLVIAAGGVVVQAMPGADPRMVDQIVESFGTLQHISYEIEKGASAESLLHKVLPEPIHWYESQPIKWECVCSRQHSYELLGGLPRTEIEALVREGGAEITCNFCLKSYRFSEDELLKLNDRA